MSNPNPVMQALLNARIQEEERMEAPVVAVINEKLNLPPAQGDKSAFPLFEEWCARNKVRAYPCRPATVAYFVIQHRHLHLGELMQIIRSISAVHEGAALADPTLGACVAHAFHQIDPIEPPRSWATEERHLFLQMPRPLQTYVARRERERDVALNRAQNKAAAAAKDAEKAIRQLADKIHELNKAKGNEANDDNSSRSPPANRDGSGRLQCRNRRKGRAVAEAVPGNPGVSAET
jgi:hypothetical protein